MTSNTIRELVDSMTVRGMAVLALCRYPRQKSDLCMTLKKHLGFPSPLIVEELVASGLVLYDDKRERYEVSTLGLEVLNAYFDIADKMHDYLTLSKLANAADVTVDCIIENALMLESMGRDSV